MSGTRQWDSRRILLLVVLAAGGFALDGLFPLKEEVWAPYVLVLLFASNHPRPWLTAGLAALVSALLLIAYEYAPQSPSGIEWQERMQGLTIVWLVAFITILHQRRLVERARREWQLEEIIAARTSALRKTNEKLYEEIRMRDRLADELRRSEERYQRALLGSPVSLFSQDAALRYTWVCNVLAGVDPEWAVGKEDADIFPPADAERLTRLKRGVLESGERLRERLEVSFRQQRVVVDLTLEPMRDAEGGVRGVNGISVDITDRLKSEEALLEANLRLEAVIDASPAAVLSLDTLANVTSWNPAAERIFGWRKEEVLDKPYPPVPTEREAEFRSIFTRILSGETFTGLELKRLRKDGTTVDISLSTAPLRDATGGVIGVMSSVLDITERLQMREQLVQLQKMEAIGQLAGGVAHDFNNLLTAILGFCEMQSKMLEEENPAREYAEQIRHAAEQAGNLTRQLLAFGRRQVLQPKVIDINEAIRENLKMYERLAGEGIAVETKLEDGLGLVLADPFQMQQILLNLVVNARDAMRGSGRLEIKTANAHLDESDVRGREGVQAGPHVALVIADDGGGMDRETLTRIFEPFFTTKKLGQGTGLGLSIVFGIVKQSGGDIRVESRQGVGTTFLIYFPRAGKADEAPIPPPPEQAARGQETIMLVEDEPLVRMMTCEALTDMGYLILQAEDGAAALRLHERHQAAIDLMITDVVMPGMTGVELTRQLRLRQPGLKVLFMSGYTEDAIVHHGVLETGIHFLGKPFTLNKLSAAVRNAIETPVSP